MSPLTDEEKKNGEQIRRIGYQELGWLSINRYGAICLNSTKVFFGDIDCLPTFEPSRPCKPYRTWEDAIDRIFKVADEDDLQFRVYRTHSGVRLLETSQVHVGESRESIDRLYRLGCDPAYRELTREQNNFRVRLTPKPWRAEEYAETNFKEQSAIDDYLNNPRYRIAIYMGMVGRDKAVIPEALQIIEMHDRYCHCALDLPLA